MSTVFSRITAFFEAIPDGVRGVRVVLWTLFIALTAVAVSGLGRVDLDNSVNAFFRDDVPVKHAYDKFRAVFGSDEVLYIVYEAKDGNVFSPASLAALQGIQDELWGASRDPDNAELDHITDVVTLINVSYLEASDGALISRDFVSPRLPADAWESARLKRLALDHPDYPRLLVSEDGRYGGIIIRTDYNAEILAEPAAQAANASDEFSFEMTGALREDALPEFRTTMMEEYVPFIATVRAITDKPEYTAALQFHYSGNPEFMGFVARVVMSEMVLIILGSLVLIALVLALIFRSASAVVWPLVIVIMTTIWMLGSIGWSGVPTGDTVNIMIFLMIAVGIADSVHILSGYVLFRRRGREHAEALRAVFAKSGFACFLTTLTTAAGLLSLTFVPIVTMQRFGLFAALGVGYAFLLTIIMLPLMLDAWAPLPKWRRFAADAAATNSGSPVQRLLGGLERLSARRPVAVIGLFAVLGPALLGGFALIQVDSNTLTIFDDELPLRRNFELIDRTMAGTGNMEVVIDTGIADGHKDPAVLHAIDRFQRELEQRYPETVHKTISLVNVTKDSYRVLNGGGDAMYRIPDDHRVLAQTLVLFDGANPKDRRLLVSDDYRISRITANTRNLSSREMVAFMAALDGLAASHFDGLRASYPGLDVSFTGQIPLFMKMLDDLSWSQIKSFAVTLTIVSLILLLVLGSPRAGLVAILPNLFPIVTVFGVMGYLGIPLDLHTLLVIPIIIGISADDTIHFLTHFRLEYARSGDAGQAIHKAMSEVGQAILFTSVVLALGYLVFLISVNQGFVYFGFLSSIAITMAAVADLILLPAILRLVYGNRPATLEQGLIAADAVYRKGDNDVQR